MYLTVTTDSLMHPIAFKITLPMKVTAELLVFGLNIEGAINLV